MKKLNTQVVLVLALMLVALVAGVVIFGGGSAQAAHPGTTVFVDAATSPATGSGTRADPFRSIQLGVDHANDGDTIRVKAGVYKEKVVVTTANLVLRGVGGQPTVDAGGETKDGPDPTPGFDSAIRIAAGANGVTVDNFRVTNGGDTSGAGSDAGIRVESDNNTIINNTATLNRRAGIFVSGGNNNTIQGNHIIANTVCGITLTHNSDGNTVKGNKVELNGSSGIRVQIDSDGNTISGNNIHNNRGDGIRIWIGSGAGADNNVVTGNNLDDNVLNGLRLRGAVTGNTIAQNNASLNFANGFWVDDAGATGNTFDRNQATANTVWGYKDESTGAPGNTYTKNKCRNNTVGGSVVTVGGNVTGLLCTPQT